jgi:hypothetical protein
MTQPRRIVAPLVAVIALSTFVAGAQGASGDSFNGNGRLTVVGETARVNVSAKSDVDGSNASGTIRIDRTGEHPISGVADVICLRVEGNEASAVGRLRRPQDNPNPNVPGSYYHYVLVWAIDNGPPSGGPDEWNTAANWGPLGAPSPIGCNFFVGGGENEIGDFRVTDN